LFARRDDVRPRVQDDHVEGRDLEPTNDVGQRVSGVDVLEDDGEVVAPVVVGDTGRDALTKVELTKRLVAELGCDRVATTHDHLSKDVAAHVHAALEALGEEFGHGRFARGHDAGDDEADRRLVTFALRGGGRHLCRARVDE